jgi:hypothetical protein
VSQMSQKLSSGNLAHGCYKHVFGRHHVYDVYLHVRSGSAHDVCMALLLELNERPYYPVSGKSSSSIIRDVDLVGATI